MPITPSNLLKNGDDGQNYVNYYCSCFYTIFNILLFPFKIIFYPLYLSYKYFTKPERSIKTNLLSFICATIGIIIPTSIIYGLIYFGKHHLYITNYFNKHHLYITNHLIKKLK